MSMRYVSLHDRIDTPSHTPAHTRLLERTPPYNKACAAESIKWASRRDLQFDTAKTEAALFTSRSGHKKHLQPKLTAKIKVAENFV